MGKGESGPERCCLQAISAASQNPIEVCFKGQVDAPDDLGQLSAAESASG